MKRSGVMEGVLMLTPGQFQLVFWITLAVVAAAVLVIERLLPPRRRR